MDIKITKGRFSNLLSYDFIKIILAIVAAVMVWVLLFTTCATRATVGEQFYFVTFGEIYSKDSDFAGRMLSDLKEKNKLSYDVLDLNAVNVTAAGNYSALYMLSLKAATKEGDVMLFNGNKTTVLTSDGKPETDEDGNEKKKINDEAQAIVNNGYIVNFSEYLDSAGDYLDKFTVNGKIDEKTVEKYFLEVRMKEASNYRKTFRTAEQKKEGVKLETERLKTLSETYESVKSFLKTAEEDGADVMWYADYNVGETYGKQHVPYGIDLDKMNKYGLSKNPGAKKLSEYFWYYENVKSEETGETTVQNFSEGLVLSVFNYGNDQYDLQFESLAVIERIIRTFTENA